MIYFDNAATSRFKPEGVIKAVLDDLKNSANSGRSGHDAALTASLFNEKCRSYLLGAYGASTGYDLVFTKNCTEALNLAMFGYIKVGDHVVTTANEHNSVLRPLYELERDGKISLNVINQIDDGTISSAHIERAVQSANFCVVNAVSNVTGARVDLDAIGKYTSKRGVPLLVDGAQASPIFDIDMTKQNIDMLAMPAHKGLHGTQGVGFLIFRNTYKLRPLIYGGTGTASDSVYQPLIAPEAYEAGTVFSGGIRALHEGAVWSFQNAQKARSNALNLAKEFVYYLKNLKAKIYTRDLAAGVISFNFDGFDSAKVADFLNANGIAVRSGLHCAPLVHNFLGTLDTGAVRVSIGVDNTAKDVYQTAAVLERMLANQPN